MRRSSKQLESYGCAGFGIGECVVVVGEVETAGRGYGVELVVLEMFHFASSGAESVEELVVGVVHAVDLEYRFQASFVEAGVVGHEGQALNERLYLTPHGGENGCAVGVVGPQAVHATAPVDVVVRLGADERVIAASYDAATHNDNTHAAYRAWMLVGGFEVDSCKILHYCWLLGG